MAGASSHPIHIHPVRPLYRFTATALGASMWFFVSVERLCRWCLEWYWQNFSVAYVPRQEGWTSSAWLEAPLGPLNGIQALVHPVRWFGGQFVLCTWYDLEEHSEWEELGTGSLQLRKRPIRKSNPFTNLFVNPFSISNAVFIFYLVPGATKAEIGTKRDLALM